VLIKMKFAKFAPRHPFAKPSLTFGAPRPPQPSVPSSPAPDSAPEKPTPRPEKLIDDAK